ncbi:MAG: histidine ammonia-lyase [Calditrichaeota bacterium]|nr:histidine ammonia-lyase [Calditrichota bacterium]
MFTIDIKQRYTLKTITTIITSAQEIELSPAAQKQLVESRKVVEQVIKSDQTVYGINTGFGKFSEQRISNEEIEELQRRIVLSHSAGTGDPIPDRVVKIMMLLKIISLVQGNSGVSPHLVDVLVEMFNKDVIPVVPAKGSVGASGDLAPLAHMTLPLIGEGECIVNNKRMKSIEAFKLTGIETVTLGAKDGLAFLNGTQTMAAYLCESLMQAESLIKQADIVAGMTLEALTGTAKAFDHRIHELRHHSGQQQVAANLRLLLKGSQRIDSRKQVQDAYSLRCIPQVHGSVRDTFAHCLSVLENEINAVTDNPLVFIDGQDIISGGNFHGEPLALIADFMGIAIAELANISERRIAHLVDPHVSNLPAFLVEKGGLNSGYMIAQYTAAALVSENKVLAHPASVDSVPTSANKEDHVSMGTHASRKLLEIVENSKQVLAIELLCAVQGIDLSNQLKPSALNQQVHKIVRKQVAKWEIDRLMSTDMQTALNILSLGELLKIDGITIV